MVDPSKLDSTYLVVHWQVNVFLNRLNGQPIGVSLLGMFVIDKNTILAVRSYVAQI